MSSASGHPTNCTLKIFGGKKKAVSVLNMYRLFPPSLFPHQYSITIFIAFTQYRDDLKYTGGHCVGYMPVNHYFI